MFTEFSIIHQRPYAWTAWTAWGGCFSSCSATLTWGRCHRTSLTSTASVTPATRACGVRATTSAVSSAASPVQVSHQHCGVISIGSWVFCALNMFLKFKHTSFASCCYVHVHRTIDWTYMYVVWMIGRQDGEHEAAGSTHCNAVPRRTLESTSAHHRGEYVGCRLFSSSIPPLAHLDGGYQYM